MAKLDALPVHLTILFLVLTMTICPSRGADKEEGGFRNFISRSGDKLMDGDQEFRFIGANMPGLGLPYDYTLFMEERMTMPTAWELEDGFKTLAQMNSCVVRLWNLPIRAPGNTNDNWQPVLAPGKFNAQTFKSMDMMLAMANKHRIRVIFALTADYGDYLGGVKTYASYHNRKREAFYTNPAVKEDYKKTIRYVLNRKNSITGTFYRDDKAIMCWQFGNEFHHVPNPVEWETEMVGFIRQFDKNHLIMTGRDRGNCLSVIPDVIDICDRHYYGGDWVRNASGDRKATKGKRPLIIGEYGLTSNPEEVKALLQTVVNTGISGALIWSLYFHDEDGGFKWHQIHTHPSITAYHWPGFPNAERHNEQAIMTILREYAYKIQGKDMLPLPVPEMPELLPLGDYPLLSWRGSVGASGYDIQRAESADGPWDRIAENVSDADSVYRPLYCDATAAPGKKYYYRIAARNSSGVSEATKPVGPVTFKSSALVDELKDETVAESMSPDMVFGNDYNWRFAEHNYRAVGKEGSELVYKVDGRIEKVSLVFFAEKNWQDNVVVGVSADGKSFTAVKGRITKRQLGTLPKKRKPPIEMVTFRADVVEKASYLRLSWKSKAWLDRVEIFHDQTP